MKQPSTEKTMTVKEIAAAANVSQDTILRAIDRLFPGLKRNGVATHLNEYETTRIIEDVKKNYSLRTAAEVTTDLQMKEKTIEVISWLTSEIEKEKSARKAAEEREKKLIPKAEFYDAVTDSRDTIDMSTAAKLLNKMGRNKLFEFLRNIGVFMYNNQPYQKYVDKGYFRVIEQGYEKPNGVTGINIKTLVYQSGLDFIRKKFQRSE